MSVQTLPCLSARALPPIGRRQSFTSAGVTSRAVAIFVGAVVACLVVLRADLLHWQAWSALF